MDNPEVQVVVRGTFPTKTIQEVGDFITDALHDWLNPNWKEGEVCICEFVVTSGIATDDVD